MESVTLYTTHCPKCDVLSTKLKDADISFTVVDDIDKVVEIGMEHHIMLAPILQVDDKVMAFNDAMEWLMSTKK